MAFGRALQLGMRHPDERRRSWRFSRNSCDHVGKLSVRNRIVVQGAMRLDVRKFRAELRCNVGERRHLFGQRIIKRVTVEEAAFSTEAGAVRVGRMRTDRNAVCYCRAHGGRHALRIARMAATRDVAARDNLQELLIVRIALTQVRIEIDVRHMRYTGYHVPAYGGNIMSVALVTGASSGIGAAIAIAFADASWEVMAAGRDESRLAEVADVSDNIATWAGELAESADCDELVADTIEEFGEIDCLVNCAGIMFRGDAIETTDDDWRDTLSVNLDVPFFLSRAATPHLQRSQGSIVNISSYWGLHADERTVAYATSKGGLIMLTKAMAKDLAGDGVSVNAICPGGVDTPMLAAAAADTDLDVDEFLGDIAENSPNGRIATPEEIAGLVLFLASDAGKHITATAIPIDGGLAA